VASAKRKGVRGLIVSDTRSDNGTGRLAGRTMSPPWKGNGRPKVKGREVDSTLPWERKLSSKRKVTGGKKRIRREEEALYRDWVCREQRQGLKKKVRAVSREKSDLSVRVGGQKKGCTNAGKCGRSR